MPYAIRLSPFMVASSGSPFNITSGSDLNGDSIFNDRPGLMSTATCPSVVTPGPGSSVYCTPLGTFDALPTPSERLTPIYYGTGPAHVTLNLRLSKTFGFGPKVKSSPGNQSGVKLRAVVVEAAVGAAVVARAVRYSAAGVAPRWEAAFLIAATASR